MQYITIVFAVILIALGLIGYAAPDSSANQADKKSNETSSSEAPQKSGSNKTALIPSIAGVLLLIGGTFGLKKEWRKHAMHAAAAIGLLGFILAFGRVCMKIGPWLSGDESVNQRAMIFISLMAVVCLLYVGFSVRSFIAARRARLQSSS
jgi:hypothetical protein